MCTGLLYRWPDPLEGGPSFSVSHYTLIYKYDIDTPPTYIYKYDAVRTALYTPSGGGGGGRGIGTVYSVSPFVQRGHGIGSFHRGLWRTVQPVLWSCAMSLGREALRTGGNIMTDIAANPGQTGDILSKHAAETTQNIIKNCAAVDVREREHLTTSIRPRELKSRSKNLLNARPLPKL